MDKDLFHTVGDLLFGPMFRRRLADALDVTERTIGRWEKGLTVNGIPLGVARDLARICREQAKKLLGMAKKLEKLAGEE